MLLEGDRLPRFLVLCAGLWLHAASSMLAATTLPRAVVEIGGHQLIGWAFSLYQLGSILAGAGTAILVARAGLRAAVLLGAALYGAGCCVSALAPDMPTMLTGRLLQGLGGGWLVALTYVGLNRLFPNVLIPRLVALTSVIWSVSAFCGPLIGGSFAALGLWRFAFWAFALQALAFFIAARKLLPRSRQPTAGPAVFPAGRLAVLAAAVLLVSWAGAEIDALLSPLLCLAGIALLWVFLRIDRTAVRARMLPRRVLDLNDVPGAGLLMVFTASASTMSFLVYGAFLLDVLHAISPLTAGYVIALESVSWGLVAIVFSGAGESLEKRLIRAGIVLVAAGVLGFTLFMPGGVLWLLLACAVCQGAGFGMMWGFVVRRVIAAAPEGERERASSALPTTQQIGFAVGAAVCGIIANAAGFADGVSVDAARRVAFWVFAGFLPLVAFAIVAAWKFTGQPHRL